MGRFLKIMGLALLFIILMNISTKVFNLFDPWIGIAIGLSTIISYTCLIIYCVKKYKF